MLEDKRELAYERNYKIIKSNEIIRHTRFDLTKEEFKLLSYILSKIKPTDTEFTSYTLSLKDYCVVCGIDYNNRNNYDYIKKAAKKLRDRSFWMVDTEGNDLLFSWVTRVKILRGVGKIEFKLSEDLQKHVMGLFDNFTQITLLSILPMNSVYSMRLYELLKSYAFTGSAEFELNDLKGKLFAENYKMYKDFRVRVLEIAIKEINTYTDIEVQFEPQKNGRKVEAIKFHIKQLDGIREYINLEKARNVIEGQMTIDQFFEKEKNE